ncbi:hypothetical protein BGZ57DRAFT_763984 [Hyaloscypha finlandica]|nr:hypothetical protein BGZ57DRAFT_763984 [Hyaloscypha finlandica]KAH8793773.1 hypothetical protein F5882DRAFT_289459 [Hyaloscypha sp. PMI_1271]
MTCYCANYYGSINCHNTVPRFGDRCALCLVTSGSSSSSSNQNGIQKADEQWVENVNREKMRRDEEKTRRERVSRTTSGRIR